MTETAGVAPAVKRRPLDSSATGIVTALGGAVLAVVAVWLPYWDPASLRRAYGSDVGWVAQVLEGNSLIDESFPIGWLFVGLALACTMSVGVSCLRRRRTQGPVIAGAIAMCLAALAAATASALTPVNFGGSYGTATAGLGIYAEFVAGFLMVIGGLAIRRRAPVRALLALIAVGVAIATSAWWYGSTYGGEPAPKQIIVNAPDSP